MMDFDESLPSSSKFIGEDTFRANAKSFGWQNNREKTDDRFQDDELNMSMSFNRTPSPPPPPPPLTQSMRDQMKGFKMNVMVGGGSPEATMPPPVTKTPSGSFPFLKKGSRKEPTALNKRPDSSPSKSPLKQDVSSENGSNKKAAKNDNTPAMNGTDYWGLASNILDDMTSSKLKASKQTSNMFDDDENENEDDDFKLYEQGNNRGRRQQESDNEASDEDDIFMREPAAYKTPMAPNSTSNNTIFSKARTASSDGSSNKRSASLDRHPSPSWGSVTQPLNIYDDDDEGPDDHQIIESSTRPKPLPPKIRSSSDDFGSKDSSDLIISRSTPITNSTHTTERSESVGRNRLAQSTVKKIQENHSTATSHLSSSSSATYSTPAPQPPKSIINTYDRSSSVASSNATPMERDADIKLIRPVSSLKKDMPRSTTPGRKLNGNKKTSQQQQIDELQLSLETKAKELEKELETYKNENANLRRLRKQQEQALTEISQKRSEMMKYFEEEKQKTLQWCEEQKQIADRERKFAAKQARESRQKANAPPIRKEKAEMEALQATIEKLKIDNELASKRSKLNENRLYGLVKEHSQHIDDIEKQLITMDEIKLQLLDFITQSGLRLPKSLRAKLSEFEKGNNSLSIGGTRSDHHTTNNTPGSQKKSSYASKISGDKGYVEEVDVEEILPSNDYHHHMEGESNPLQTNSIPGEVFNRLSNHLTTDFTATKGNIPNNNNNNNNGNKHHHGNNNHFIGPKVSSMDDTHYASTSSSSLKSSHRKDNIPAAAGPSLMATQASWSSRSSARYSQLEEENNDDEYYTTGGGGEEDYHEDAAASYNHSHNHNVPSSHSSSRNSNNNNKFPKSTPFSIAAVGTPRETTDTNTNTASKKTGMKNTLSSTTSSTSGGAGGGPDNTNGGSNSGRVEEVKADGSKVVRYRNGTIKEVDKSGKALVKFINGDTKFTDPESGSVVYYYAQADTTHTTYRNGIELYEFPNGQIEKHFPDQTKEVTFPDHTKKIIYPDGIQESIFPDGVVLREYPDGRKEVISKE